MLLKHHHKPYLTVVVVNHALSFVPQCAFLNSEVQSPPVFSPSSLHVAACDLQQLMTTFSHVYETDLRAYCTRDPPSFKLKTHVFQRVHQLLLACNTVLTNTLLKWHLCPSGMERLLHEYSYMYCAFLLS